MMNKILKSIWKIIKAIITIVIVAIAVVLVLPKLLGIQPLAVLSGSMEPTYHVGSLIYVKSIDVDEIEVGESLTFKKDMGSGTTNVTHRVVRIDDENECFYTKGDANESEDLTPTSFSDIVGKPIFTIPYLGYIGMYMSSQAGKIIGITITIILLILLFLPDYLIKRELKNE